MDIKQYYNYWLDKKYGGSPQIDDWTNEEVIQFAEDYKNGKFLNEETVKREKGCPTCKHDDYNAGKPCPYSKTCGEPFRHWEKNLE